jgi:predicted Co/Zn/Cd cation transporter (cation efflux family)
LVAAALILPAPIRMLRQSFRELLEGVPDPGVTDPIHAAIDQVCREFGLPQPAVRVGKLGRKVYLELDFLVDEDAGWTVNDADQVRRQLLTELAEPGRLLWINVELHTDPAWDEQPLDTPT